MYVNPVACQNVHRVAGRDQASQEQGKTASRVSTGRLQGTHSGTTNESGTQEERLSEGGLGTGEWLADAMLRMDLSSRGKVMGRSREYNCWYWSAPRLLPSLCVWCFLATVSCRLARLCGRRYDVFDPWAASVAVVVFWLLEIDAGVEWMAAKRWSFLHSSWTSKGEIRVCLCV